MKTAADALVERYLKDLGAELRGLPGNRRREIMGEVQEHLLEARAGLATDNEVAVRTVLERLGDPAEIAAEARERFGVQPGASSTPWLEIAALLVVVVPFVGWLASLLMLWLSQVWNRRDKIIGTAFSPLAMGTLVLLSLAAPSLGLGLTFVALGAVLAAIAAIAYLAVQLVRNARQVAQVH